MPHKLTIVVSAVALAACGGQVVFEEDGGGVGGSTASSQSTSSSTDKPKPGPEPDPRRDLCESICQPPCAENNCVESCLDELFGGGCDHQAGDLITCWANNLDINSCTIIGACEAEQAAYAECPLNTCSDGCSHSDLDCSCLRDCDGGEYQMSCELIDDAVANCECSIGGTLIVTCVETHLACDIDFGCCAAAFEF
jgi:hypothetical protein